YQKLLVQTLLLPYLFCSLRRGLFLRLFVKSRPKTFSADLAQPLFVPLLASRSLSAPFCKKSPKNF
ncbi:MAG: hypothetical protein II323_06025, partial [Tidjanibacter sp.]|nr:hypothetical protein [Tidjanibacter sp.]